MPYKGSKIPNRKPNAADKAAGHNEQSLASREERIRQDSKKQDTDAEIAIKADREKRLNEFANKAYRKQYLGEK